jgi:predicted DNA binding CopG/RHH family protein
MSKKLPTFHSDEEIESFMEQDISEYINKENFRPVQFEFMPKDAKINMRLPLPLLENIKRTAQERGISYQRYIRMALEQSLQHPHH